MGEQLALDMRVPEGPPPADVPLVYVASPLSHLAEKDRSLVCAWAQLVKSALRDFRFKPDTEVQDLRVHVPALQSAPWLNGDATPGQIYTTNRRLVQTDCDMLIVLACDGVSGGVGQEINWAIDAGIPVLYLHSHSETVSKQLRGHPAITIRAFQTLDPESLTEAVRGFVRSERRDLLNGPNRRSELAVRFNPTMQALTVAWHSASPARQAETLALARLSEDELNHAFAHPLLFGLQSHRVVDSLASGLGVALEPPAWPELSAADRNALMIAAEEATWTVRRTLQLQDAARLELARGGTRRLSFATPRDWYDFDQRTP